MPNIAGFNYYDGATPLSPRVVNHGDGTYSLVTGVDNVLSTQTWTIASGASLSTAIDLANDGIIRLLMPAAWTAASITLNVSPDGITYYDLYDRSGIEYAITVAASRAVILSPADFAGFRYVKLRSGTASAPVNQAAARSILGITRPL